MNGEYSFSDRTGKKKNTTECGLSAIMALVVKCQITDRGTEPPKVLHPFEVLSDHSAKWREKENLGLTAGWNYALLSKGLDVTSKRTIGPYGSFAVP